MGRVLCCWRGTGGLVLCWKGMGGKVLCCWRDTGAGSCAAGGVRGQGPVLLERCGGRVLCCWTSMGAGSCAVGGVWGQGPVFLGCSLLLLACNCGRSRHAHPYHWDDKPGKPRRVIPVRFGVFWPKPRNGWDDTPGAPRRVIPDRFGVFWPKRAGKTRKRTGMTSLGSPGASSESVSGFFGRKRPGKPQNGLG